MSNLIFPSTGGVGEGASITPPPFYTPAKLLQPRTTSQDLKPLPYIPESNFSSHLRNTNIEWFEAGPFKVTGGTLLPIGEYVIVQNGTWPPGSIWYAYNIDTQETIELLTYSDWTDNYTLRLSSLAVPFKANIFENKLWIQGIDANGKVIYDAYEGLNLTNRTISYDIHDIGAFVSPTIVDNPGFLIDVLSNPSDSFSQKAMTLTASNYGIPLYVHTRVSGAVEDYLHIILISSSGIRLVESVNSLIDTSLTTLSLVANANNNTNSFWLVRNKSAGSEYIKYTITSTSFSKKISSINEWNGVPVVINENILLADRTTYYIQKVTLCEDNSTSLNNTTYPYSEFFQIFYSSYYIDTYTTTKTTSGRWAIWTEETYPRFVYCDDDTKAIPPTGSLWRMSNDINLGNTHSGKRLIVAKGYSGVIGDLSLYDFIWKV